MEAFALHKKYGGKGIHYVGGYTQAHLTLWIRRMVGMLQRPNAKKLVVGTRYKVRPPPVLFLDIVSPHMGVSENSVPHFPNGFADHYPYFSWLFHWED